MFFGIVRGVALYATVRQNRTIATKKYTNRYRHFKSRDVRAIPSASSALVSVPERIDTVMARSQTTIVLGGTLKSRVTQSLGHLSVRNTYFREQKRRTKRRFFFYIAINVTSGIIAYPLKKSRGVLLPTFYNKNQAFLF